jgi:hypothetical protein
MTVSGERLPARMRLVRYATFTGMLAPSKWLRVARWVMAAGLGVACASAFLPEYRWGNDPTVPAVEHVRQFDWPSLLCRHLWPFGLLALTGAGALFGGPRGRRIVGWTVCIYAGVMILAMSAQFVPGDARAIRDRLAGRTSGAEAYVAAALAKHVFIALAGFACLCLPAIRAAGAMLAASVALAGAAILLNDIPVSAGVDISWVLIRLMYGFWVGLAGAAVMFLAGTWEAVIHLRRRAALEEDES